MSRFIHEQDLEAIEEESSSGVAIFMVESGENLVQHRRCPLSFENLISRQGVDWFQIETVMLGNFFKRECFFAPTALCRHRPVSLVREKVLERHEQVGTQPPFF